MCIGQEHDDMFHYQQCQLSVVILGCLVCGVIGGVIGVRVLRQGGCVGDGHPLSR